MMKMTKKSSLDMPFQLGQTITFYCYTDMLFFFAEHFTLVLIHSALRIIHSLMKYVRARTAPTPPCPILQADAARPQLVNYIREYSANNLANKRRNHAVTPLLGMDDELATRARISSLFHRGTRNIRCGRAIFDWPAPPRLILMMVMTLEAAMSCAGHGEVARVSSSTAKLITIPTSPLLPYCSILTASATLRRRPAYQICIALDLLRR